MKYLKKFFVMVAAYGLSIFLAGLALMFLLMSVDFFLDIDEKQILIFVSGYFCIVLARLFVIPIAIILKKYRAFLSEYKLQKLLPKNQWEHAKQMQIVENQKRVRMQRASANSLWQTQLQYYPIQRNGQKVKRLLATDLTSFNCRDLTKAIPLKSIRTFIAFDTETTGLSVGWNDIIELSAIKFVDFRPQSVFTTFLKPRKPIPPDATAINHITDAMVANAPSFYEILPSFEAFVGDSPMVAHNAMFDLRHLYASGMESIAYKVVFDTCSISRKMDIRIPNHKLGTACIARNIRLDNAHRAVSDAMACGMLFVQYVLETKGCNSIEDLLRQIYPRPALQYRPGGTRGRGKKWEV